MIRKKELKNSETKLIYDIMIMAHGFRKNNAVRTCWGETGGFVETKLLSEKVNQIHIYQRTSAYGYLRFEKF